MQVFKIRVKPVESRLDRFLSQKQKELSRSKIQKLISEGFVKVNHKAVSSNYKIRSGDLISLEMPAPKPTEIKGERLPIKVIYEDTDTIVIDKPAGVVVHPTADHTSGTVVNWLLQHLGGNSQLEKDIRTGIVHRLDKDSSGLLIIGKNDEAVQKLKAQFATRKVEKKYLALVVGEMEKPFGTIKTGIGRDPSSFKKFAVSEEGKPAETEYRLKTQYKGYSLLEVYPKTGRTHQIRVHLSSIGHPIAGDKLYGGKMSLSRPFLHAVGLILEHPINHKEMSFESNLAGDLQSFLDKLSLNK